MSKQDLPQVPLHERLLLTVVEVAAVCGVSISTANRWTNEGLRTIPHCTYPKKVRRIDLDEFLAMQQSAAVDGLRAYIAEHSTTPNETEAAA